MTTQQQQRLLGAILLLLVIVSTVIFLINNTHKSASSDEVHIVEQLVLDNVSDGDIEIVNYGLEATVDPHHLSAQTEAITEPATQEISVMQEKVTEIESTQAQAAVITEAKPVDIEPIKIQTEVKPQASDQWILQLAGFSVEANAKALQNKIAAAGYKPKIQQSETNTGFIYRVRIGPEYDKVLLEKQASKLQKEQGVKSQILLYKP